MATSLQQQLAAINAKSTNQLNLKAQREQHSKSLLFEPKEAAGQTFETIYQICLDGFTELCQLDRRFTSFAGTLFAEGSIAVEREHITKTENEELDKVIEQFLGLVSGRLLLLPAHKSVEWLVRRWKVHEQNPAALVYAFLPYHDHDSFPTVLSLLPRQLPASLAFLKPYIASLRSPPRHALATAAFTNANFQAEYTSFVLGTAARKHQSSSMLGLWASIIARAVNAMLDAAQSGREQVRKQKMEDVMVKVLPILQDTLAVSSSEELFLAACIIITLLASKGQLIDSAIDALMESITDVWSANTRVEAIECLILLAEEKEEAKLPRKVANALIDADGAISVLLSLQTRFETGNLVTGVVDRALRNIKANKHEPSASTIKSILSNGSVQSGTVSYIRKELATLADSGELPRDMLLDLPQASAQLTADANDEVGSTEDLDIDLDEPEDAAIATKLDAPLGQLPPLSGDFFSFLDLEATAGGSYESYFAWFESRCKHSKDTLQADLKVILSDDNSQGNNTRLLTFLAALWCDKTRSIPARVHALQIASEEFADSSFDAVPDYQPLYPSLILGLCDPALPVRRASIVALTKQPGSLNREHVLWGRDVVYGSRSAGVSWLPHEEYVTFFKQAIGGQMEDSILSIAATIQAITAWLDSSDHKTSHLCEAFASQAIADTRDDITQLLFGILSNVGDNAEAARQEVIIPFISKYLDHQIPSQLQQAPRLIIAALECLTHHSAVELDVLKRLADHEAETISTAAFKQIARLFKSLQSNEQKAVFLWFVERIVPARVVNTATEMHGSTASETLRSMDLPLDVLTNQLALALIRPSPSSPEQTRPWKKARLDKLVRDKAVGDTNHEKLRMNIKIATLCLELIEDALSTRKQAKSLSSLRSESYVRLLKCLFNLLAEAQSWQSSTGSSFTYLQSLALANMISLLEAMQSSGQQLDVSIMRTDLLVDTLRSTANPQVHNNALLLISKIATIAPDTILHSVMPLFTFMSSATLRQADAYSAHVISMTIESIVPPLVASLKQRKRDLVIGASDLLLSFIAAFEHIPSPRRVETFVQLLKTLGPDDTLHAILAMLIERYDGDTTLPSVLNDIMSSFSVETQMLALAKYLEVVTDACKKRRTVSDSILGFQEKNAAEAHASVRVLLEGFAGLLQNGRLMQRVAAQYRLSTSTERVRDDYASILQLLVSLPENEGSIVNYNEPGLKRAHGNAIEALLRLLPLADFIASSAMFMQAGTEAVRAKVFASLTSRVGDARSGDLPVATVFLEALPNCAVFLAPSQPVSVRQAALLCIDAICEKFGRLDREAVSSVISTVVGESGLASDSPVLQTAAMLCLASAVEVLGESFVSLSTSSLQLTLNHAQAGLAASPADWSMVDAAFSFVNSLLDYQAWLLTGGDGLERAIVLACTVARTSHTSAVVKEFCALAPKKVQASVMNTALLRAFDNVLNAGPAATAELVKLEHGVIKYHTKKEVLKHTQGFFDFMLRAMGIRETFASVATATSRNQEGELRQLDLATKATTQAMMDLTLKLNDVTFRPFFIELSDWARSDSRRAIALFEYTSVLFDQLGSIVTSYASFILDESASILKTAKDTLAGTEDSELLNRVLSSLSASFRHDQDDFWTSTTHFEAIEGPLLDLLRLQGPVHSAVASEVVVDLASAVSASPDLLKVMNTHLMTLLRDDDHLVRLSAVKCQRAVTEKLTFDWLNMLPEMLPFISELLEDDDEAVEREALRWVSQLEDVTGESLEGMLA